jgi:hypothetical protein
MKFPRTDQLYKKAIKIKHIPSKDNGVANAIAYKGSGLVVTC